LTKNRPKRLRNREKSSKIGQYLENKGENQIFGLGLQKIQAGPRKDFFNAAGPQWM